MTIETCYEKLGGNYQEVSARIPSESLIRKFVSAFPKDPSFEGLCTAMDAGNRETAFREAHTLKGVCANLGFDKLRQSVSELTEVLRQETDQIPESAFPLMEEVRKDYKTTIDAISALLAEA